ncbi:MAG: sigma-54 dependent transcriptional regulator [Desulfobacterales bacterium]|jgi:two-component system nitrogen regulation response regulator NtrX|nr:sigma-54 dependent transcriptional regulator [Desulfobacterales bacterium]
MHPSVLIVDDEKAIRQSLSGILSDEGFEVSAAANGYEALQMIEAEAPDLVLLDIWMQGIDGIETLKEIKKDHPHIQVILISGHGNVETAVKATKLGAFDLIEKPLSVDKVIVTINNALNYRRLEEENRYLRKKTIEKHAITGNSPPIQTLRKQIAQAAPTDASILITGENGTGKELVARTIHQLSARADKSLIDINCAAIPENLIESELFGHEKGSIPGQSGKKVGKFELAAEGTLFFDEIGDMSLSTQSKILRVLQEKQFHRVGSARTLSVNVRVIAATNKNLTEEIKKGLFREELYYRINVIPIEVPPLRQRSEDIPLLAETFLKECAGQGHMKQKKMSPEALAWLCNAPWPGNVRELKNLIERLSIMVKKDTIQLFDLPLSNHSNTQSASTSFQMPALATANLETAKKAFEEAYIRQQMALNGNDSKKTAAAIGISLKELKKILGKKG